MRSLQRGSNSLAVVPVHTECMFATRAHHPRHQRAAVLESCPAACACSAAAAADEALTIGPRVVVAAMEEPAAEAEATTAAAPISEQQRNDLRSRLADNFQALLFHREGYRPADMPLELVEQIASLVEAKAFSHVVRAAELGMSSRAVVAAYAQEAATLLLAEVEKRCVPLEPRGGSSGAVDASSLCLHEISGGLRSIHTTPPPASASRAGTGRDAAWGWLVPGSRMLPYVVLQGAGVAIGRGKEALWAVGAPSSGAGGSPRTCLASGSDRSLAAVLQRNLGFVEVADGRVSRLHCIISLRSAADGGSGGGVPTLEDCSSNGTFVNHRKLAKGESVVLEEGDRISLVLSVAPLVEQFFTFRAGDPQDPELAGSDGDASWVGSAASNAAVFSPGAVHSGSPSVCGAGSAIARTATSRYTTAEQSTLEDLRCQICLHTLRQCVALEPCGHNFCATCLSHHLGSQLQSGLQLSCPFRCPAPERIIINYAVRALIDLLGSSNGSRPASAHHAAVPGRAPSSGAAAGRSGSRLAPGGSSCGGGAAAMQGAFGHAGSSSSLAGLGGGGSNNTSNNGGAAEPLLQQQQQQQVQSPRAAAAGPVAAAAARQAAASVADAAAAPAQGGSSSGGDGGGGRSRLSSSAGQARAAGGTRAGAEPGVADDGEEDADDDYTSVMSVLCPLDDEHLPMEAANLKTRQAEVALAQLKAPGLGRDAHLVCLEALARLAWSDDGVRELVANSGGVRSCVDVMAAHAGSDSIQCNGCLALMSLVRGEGEVCQSNQWHIAKAGAIQVIRDAMVTFRHNAMVQLSVLLCLIPLALENAMMQAHITQECLPDIMAALDNHRDEVDIQTKGLVLLGVLIQGDDAVHDAIRIRELEAGVPARVAAALRLHGGGNDDVLWAVLFVLAVLVRDGSCVFGRATGALVWAGVLRVLTTSLGSYRERHEAAQLDPDEMIVSAGDYLLRVLEPVQARADARRLLLTGAGGVALLAAAGLLAHRLWAERGSSSSGSGSGSSSGSGSGSWGLAGRRAVTAAVAASVALPAAAKSSLSGG